MFFYSISTVYLPVRSSKVTYFSGSLILLNSHFSDYVNIFQVQIELRQFIRLRSSDVTFRQIKFLT